MKNKIVIPVSIAIIAAVVAIVIVVAISSHGPDTIKDVDKEKPIGDQNVTDDSIKEIDLEEKYTPKEREWITSGPFQIDRSEYVLGEKIFLRIGILGLDEEGQIVFLRPLNETHKSVYWTIPFNGTEKSSFNYYLQPQLSEFKMYCTVDAFVGEWQVVLKGTKYPNLKFEIVDEILPGDEDEYQPIC